MNATKTAMLQVPGAELYYEVRGDGPLMVIGQSGEGDARRTADLVDRLAGHYTMLTYDAGACPGRRWTTRRSR